MLFFVVLLSLSAMGNTWLGGEGWKAGELVVYSEWDDVGTKHSCLSMLGSGIQRR